MQITYLPAQYYTANISYVAYSVINPATNKLVQKRIKLNRIKSAKERKKFARQLMVNINEKLASGWNPFIEQESPKSFHKLFDAFDIFLRIKGKELRYDSIRSYKSYIKILKQFLSDKNNGNKMIVLNFKKKNAVEFLNYIYVERNVSERVYNTHTTFGKTLFNWLIENQYCKANPYYGIKKKKEKEKKRIPITLEYRKKIKEYLIKNKEYEYLAVCMLTFYAFLRPKEIGMLKPGMINLENQIIALPGEISKNGKSRTVTISDSLLVFLEKINIHKINNNNYIFSTYFKPGKLLKDSRYIAKRWNRLRREINLPKEMQFYSLKDTGIIQMLRDGISPELVRDQAGHHSLEVTNKYIKILNNSEASAQIKNKSSEF